jgi:PIN domain nuclease of toxin-antitoxin system
MDLLLDTCTFLWALWDDPELSPRARELITDPGNEVLLSAASCWEISIKHGLGKLPLPDDPARLIPEQRRRHGIGFLPLSEAEALQVHRLPSLHRDPFDRILVSQAIIDGLTILTPDPDIAAYPVQTAW